MLRVRLLSTSVVLLMLLSGCSLVRAPPDRALLENAALASPGESFLVLSGGACLDECPVYEIFVFESGRIVFNGKAHTAQAGLVDRLTMPSAYFDLRKLLAVRRAYDRRFHLGCRSDRAAFTVGAVEGNRVRAGNLSYGCFNQVDDLDAITAEFIRVADASRLIR